MGILVKNITKKFGDFVAVDDVDFQVNEGELVALLGPSGSGKSTILRIIAGLETPDSGEIYLTGKDVTSLLTQQRKIGFVFQHYALFKHMTVEKNIAFGLEIQKRKKTYIKNKIAELVDLVKLHGYEKHYPSQLSGGQRQRVALARALAMEPKVLLLDEPFGALDAKVRDNLAAWLRDFHDKLNITSVFVTHDQNEAIEISDKIVVINKGHVEQVGTAKDVYEHPGSRFVASFIGQVNMIDGIVHDGQITIKKSNYTLESFQKDNVKEGAVILLVRPEDIEISTDKYSSNNLPCRIVKIHYRGSHYEIDCDVNGTELKIIENKNRLLYKKLGENQNGFLTLKSYRVFQAKEGHDIVRERMREVGYIE